MAPSDAVQVRLDAAPIARRWFLSVLARTLPTVDGAAAAVFEQSTSDPVVRCTVTPRSVLAGVLRDTRAPFACRPNVAPFRPPGVGTDWFGALTLPSSRPPIVEPSAGPASLADLVAPSDWIGVQTLWVREDSGRLVAARRFLARSGPAGRDVLDAAGQLLARHWSGRLGVGYTYRELRPGPARRDWARMTARTLPLAAWGAPGGSVLPDLAEAPLETARAPPRPTTHRVVFGASGSGKTSYLAFEAARALADGASVVAIDLHGDLAPAIVHRLSATERARVIALDVTARPVPGIALLGGAGQSRDGRVAAHVVAALKRLSPDGSDVYWGFRLERILDTFVRITQERGGSLLDLFGLLTDAEQRECARLETKEPELARFLEELGPLVRRTPDFLWSAASRVAKVALEPAVAELLAPRGGGLPLEELIAARRALLVRLPFAAIGPEAATFAASLVLARTYFAAASIEEPARRGPVVFVLDEVQGLAPRLVAEMLSEGRKFGICTVVATQHPERLAPEVRHAAAGSVTGHLAFRSSRPAALEVASWLGVPPDAAAEWLPRLPDGHGILVDDGTGGGATSCSVPAPPAGDATPPWRSAALAARSEFGPVEENAGSHATDPDRATDSLLLAVLSAWESGTPAAPDEVVNRAASLPGIRVPRELLLDRWPEVLRRGWAEVDEGRCTLTASGSRRIGLGVATGAVRETAEHRALLLAAFRLFARRGYRLEIVQQGRFDSTLPDARLRQIPPQSAQESPQALAEALDVLRTGWAWRCFGGRDIHVEAEVSGAMRSARILHGLAKAKARRAFVVFVVGDAARARRVRTVLHSAGAVPHAAQVWTLRVARDPPGAA